MLLLTLRQKYLSALAKITQIEGLGLLALRIYLAPIMLQAGYNKFSHFDDTVNWFGNPDWGLGLPFPELFVVLAAGSEFVGALFLLVGLATRLVSIPLMITMLVAAFTVHWDKGWLAVADPKSWLANDAVVNSAEKLVMIKNILQEFGNYEWLTSSGGVVILNNGIEYSITYFIMLFVLFLYGGGRYFSLDYYIAKKLTVTSSK